jgi:hexosaminidase
LAVVVAILTVTGAAGTAWGVGSASAQIRTMANLVVPAPATVATSHSVFELDPATTISAPRGQAAAVAEQLAGQLRRSTGYRLPVVSARGDIALSLTRRVDLGTEGYRLDVTDDHVTITADQPAGLFYGVQTLRQLLPAAADAPTHQPGPWFVPGGHIVDQPRFAYRGAMLDVSRHFFPMSVVEHYIDEISLYKINYLHLHLSDDQGWRIAINGWPDLTTYGGSTEVGAGAGGYYTQARYEQLVAYARARFVTIVPEIDGPGHTNAALASYAQLNCDGVAPPLYTGTDVGFSSLCVDKDLTYTFEQAVLGQLAALTPGPYLHVGGDEAQSTTAADYATFENRLLPLVARDHKIAIGWHDILRIDPSTSVVGEYWGTDTTDPTTAAAAARGNKVILSPATRTYLDQKYTPDTVLGQNWAAYIEVRDAYDWNPGAYLTGVGESSVLGVEAPLWSETLVTTADIEYMAFPRLPAIAELGWSPESTHDWSSFRVRLGAQGPRWTAEGMDFYASPEIPWAPGTRGGVD